MQDAPGVVLREDRVGRWLLWVSLGALFLGFVNLLGNKVPWPVAYTLTGIVLILLSLIAPRKFKALALGLALIVVATLWAQQLLKIAFAETQFLQTAFARRRKLTYDDVMTLSNSLGVAIGVVSIAGIYVSGMFFASEFLLSFRRVFGLTRLEALRTLASLGFGLQYPYMIVENGEATLTKPKGLINKVGGPGLVIVRPGNAVVFERMGEVTQIVGPGPAYTKMFEFHKGVVQLRQRWLSFKADDVLTQDGVALKLSGGISARIEPATVTTARIAAAGGPGTYEWASRFYRISDAGRIVNEETIIGGEFPVYKDSVFRAVYRPAGPDWEETLAAATVALIRDAVGQLRLEDLYGNPQRGLAFGARRVIDAIERNVLGRLQTFTSSWGVEVRLVEISVLEPPKEIQQRVLKHWEIAAQRQSIEDLGEAEAHTVQAVTDTKAASFQTLAAALQSAAQAANRTLGEEQTLRLLDVLHTLTANMGHDSTSALRYIEALEKLSEHPGARIIVGPPGQDINIEQHE